MVLENMVPRKIFEPKREEITGEWRQLQKKSSKICTLHYKFLG
jgi:hypothetical protein